MIALAAILGLIGVATFAALGWCCEHSTSRCKRCGREYDEGGGHPR